MAWSSHGRSQITLVEALVSNGLLHSPSLIQAFKATDRAHFIPSCYPNFSSQPLRDGHGVVNPYQDSPQPIGYNVTISAPHMHAMMAELVYSTVAPRIATTTTTSTTPGGNNIVEDDVGEISILDVGSGSGYLTAILAHMLIATPSSSPSSQSAPPRGRVYGVEHVPELVSFSRGAIHKGTPTHISSAISILCGDGRHEATYEESGTGGGGIVLPRFFDAIHVGAASHRSAPDALISRLKPGGSLVIPIDDELHVITRKIDRSGYTDRVESGVRFVPLTSLKCQLGDDDEEE